VLLYEVRSTKYEVWLRRLRRHENNKLLKKNNNIKNNNNKIMREQTTRNCKTNVNNKKALAKPEYKK